MNFLRKISALTSDPLQSRLDRYVGRYRRKPEWRSELRPPISYRGVELFHDAKGIIRHVRIGTWRILATSASRLIAEVRDLTCNRVAVRIERDIGACWELYGLDGSLLAMSQKLPGYNDGWDDGWLETSFETGETYRVIAGLRLAPDPGASRYLPSLSERCR